MAEAWTASPAAAGRALTAVRQIREALSAVLSALPSPPGPGGAGGIRPGAAAATPGPAREEPGRGGISPELEYLSASWAAAAGRSRLVLDAAGRTAARLIVGSSPALLVPDRVSHAAVELLCEVDLTHLGMCPVDAGGCGWVFIDRSRNRSRRWCTMDGCGAHVKARRLFSAYLIGRLVNPTGYATQFNLDADRAYAYLTWDWIRGDQTGKTDMGFGYDLPVVPPWKAAGWNPNDPMQLRYVDPPPPPVIIERPAGEHPAARPEAHADDDSQAGGS